jgi:hypothetical protein
MLINCTRQDGLVPTTILDSGIVSYLVGQDGTDYRQLARGQHYFSNHYTPQNMQISREKSLKVEEQEE